MLLMSNVHNKKMFILSAEQRLLENLLFSLTAAKGDIHYVEQYTT